MEQLNGAPNCHVRDLRKLTARHLHVQCALNVLKLIKRTPFYLADYPL